MHKFENHIHYVCVMGTNLPPCVAKTNEKRHYVGGTDLHKAGGLSFLEREIKISLLI